MTNVLQRRAELCEAIHAAGCMDFHMFLYDATYGWLFNYLLQNQDEETDTK